MNILPTVSSDLKVAGRNILKLISKNIKVNTFCVIRVSKTESHFINVLNRQVQLATEDAKINVYDTF
ncbi:hypothetical protein [Bacillus pinisoli]|uniref:hypothetical protein n=1 Tax=Bacillus pinisoli TaxID=2901866 RepID=UPI001FF6B9C6|nr:hypothetical protein [Bacillus pinisoli]